jgi:EAL domain-containing protein (putative c-di-GMP-specific phosphodiesterase class I)
MSKRLGFKTVAEGVENNDQLDYLKDISCDLIQGFYLGKPMDSAKIEELLLRSI